MNLFSCGCLKRAHTESMHKSVVVRYCDKHNPEAEIERDSFDITKHEFSDNDIDEIEVVDGNLRLHLMANDLPYIEHTKDDAIAIAKAIGVTAEDLK